jgi:hypothetical protein
MTSDAPHGDVTGMMVSAGNHPQMVLFQLFSGKVHAQAFPWQT